MRIDTIALGARTNKTVRVHTWPPIIAMDRRPGLVEHLMHGRAPVPAEKTKAFLHWVNTRQEADSDGPARGNRRRVYAARKVDDRRREKRVRMRDLVQGQKDV
jgi:hypothetical protein